MNDIRSNLGEFLIDPYEPRGTGSNTIQSVYSSIREKGKIIYDQLDYINKSGNQTVDAFVALTMFTETEFLFLLKELNQANQSLDQNLYWDDLNRNEEKRSVVVSAIETLRSSLLKFIESARYLNSIHSTKPISYSQIYNLQDKDYSDPAIFNKIRNQLALEAGKEIFKNLVFGTINLADINIVDESKLKITVKWDNESDKNNKDNLFTAEFTVKRTGWYLEPTESALLIDRVNENLLRADYPLSPSNFKPTGGVSLLWSYHDDRLVPDRFLNSSSFTKRIIRSLKWLEPSIGINVSYVDFRTDKDFELGFGPVIGIFNNKLFLNSGYNLSAEGESPFYMAIGFSFSNIFDKVKEKISTPNSTTE